MRKSNPLSTGHTRVGEGGTVNYDVFDIRHETISIQSEEHFSYDRNDGFH